jgi:hypothetical protein
MTETTILSIGKILVGKSFKIRENGIVVLGEPVLLKEIKTGDEVLVTEIRSVNSPNANKVWNPGRIWWQPLSDFELVENEQTKQQS